METKDYELIRKAVLFDAVCDIVNSDIADYRLLDVVRAMCAYAGRDKK